MSNSNNFSQKLDGPIEFVTFHLKQGWTARIIIISLILASIAVIWWSVNERLALLYGAKTIIQQQADIQREIDRAQMAWSSHNHAKIAADLKATENKLMPDQNTLANWLEQHISAAKKQRIHLIYNVGRPQKMSENLGNIHEIPIQIILRPSKNLKQRDAYKRLTAFAKHITGGQWHMNVSTAIASGGGIQFEQLEMHLKVWMKGEVDQAGNAIASTGFEL